MDRRAEQIFEKFRRAPGAREIASLCAIDGLIKTVRRYKPARILEIGAGIGTLTTAIVETAAPSAYIESVEDDDFCLSALTINLGDHLNRVHVTSSIDDVAGVFDLVIVDGHQIMDVSERVAAHGLVFVEGDRPLQRDPLVRAGRPFVVRWARTVRTMADDDPWQHAKWERYQGGYRLIRYEPSVFERAHFLASDGWNNRLIGTRRRFRRIVGLEPRRQIGPRDE